MNADYIKIMRISHWSKNVMMLPGLVLGWIVCDYSISSLPVGSILLGVAAACLLCSANYTINEYLDAATDRNHPEKKTRPAAHGRISARGTILQWLVLLCVGLAISIPLGVAFLLSATALAVMGIIYNVRPIRSKDRPYVDVLTESINNPLRLMLGWYAIGCVVTPPASLLLAYWMLGAYFMAIKRLAEFRHINDIAAAAAYRNSFRYYTNENLLVSTMFYAATSSFFMGTFLIRYHIELVIGIPFLAGLMAMYLRLGLQPNSPVQYPEKLYKQHLLTVWALLTSAVLLACVMIRLEWLRRLFHPTITDQF